MKTSKEFFERLQTDEEFVKEVNDAALASGETPPSNATFVAIAKEKGYELTEKELEELALNVNQELTDEEIGKVAGGSSPLFIALSISFTAEIGASVIVTTVVD